MAAVASVFVVLGLLTVLASASAAPPAKCGADHVLVGVDYYPEQWPLEDMRDDMRAIKQDLGADIIRIGEFMWHELEPKYGVFNFTLLDLILTTAEDFGLKIMLGTPTATMPAWLFHRYPDVLQKGPDSSYGYEGGSPEFGGRRQYSFNSPVYRELSARIVRELASRYGQRESIVYWQVDNELGHEGSDLDFSNNSLQAWRAWLTEKYDGDIDKLNADWGTVFWGVTYNDFAEIPLPRWTIPGGEQTPNENFRSNQSPGMLLDFRRFRRDSVTAFSDAQVAILREVGVKGCITTNAPGGFWGKAMDHNDIFASMDLVAYDNYPVWGGSVAAPDPSKVALVLDAVRGWTPTGGPGWMVAEQLIGAQGHDIIGYTPRPGQVYAWAAASLLHGATAINFFRYRAAVFGQEEFCYGILDHSTPRGQGRKWQETQSVYKLAREHESLWLAPVRAQVALIYDTDNIFAWQAQPQSVLFQFVSEAHRMYKPFWRHGVAIDVVSAKRLLAKGDGRRHAKSILAQYKVLLLPVPMLTSEALVAAVSSFVEAGGSVWVGYRSDLKDERSQIRRTPSRLAALAGVEIAEIESLNANTGLQAVGPGGATAGLSVWREGLRIPPGSGAQAVWNYSDDFFGVEGYAAVTRLLRHAEKDGSGSEAGEVVYVGAGIDPEALLGLAQQTLALRGVPGAGLHADSNVEQVLRTDTAGTTWKVTINHGKDPAQFPSSTLAPFGVRFEAVSAEVTRLWRETRAPLNAPIVRQGAFAWPPLAGTILACLGAAVATLVGILTLGTPPGRSPLERSGVELTPHCGEDALS